MDLLRIEHEDFTLTVESTQFQRMWDKGVSVLGGEKLISSYRWSGGVKHVLLVQNDTKREIAKDTTDEAVFFEQTDYSVWVDFKKKASKAWFDSPRKDVNDRFSWKESKQLLAGYLNYGNEIGRADMLHPRRDAEAIRLLLRCHLGQARLPPRLEDHPSGH